LDELPAIPPNHQGAKRWGDPAVNTYEYASDVIQESDGGYTVLWSGDRANGSLIKFDANGNWVSLHSYQVARNNFYPQAFAKTSDGGYIIGGQLINGSSYFAYAVKINSSYAVEWARKLGQNYYASYFSDIIQLSTGEYVATGVRTKPLSTDEDVLVVELNSNGTVNTSAIVGGTGIDRGLQITKAVSDTGYLITGCTASYGQPGSGNSDCAEVYLIKLTSALGLSWTKTYGQNGAANDFINDIRVNGSGYFMSGNTGGDFTENFFYSQLSSTGILQTLGGLKAGGANYFFGEGIVHPLSDGYLITGRVVKTSAPTNSQIYTAKTKLSGAINSCTDIPQALTFVSSSGGTIVTPAFVINDNTIVPSHLTPATTITSGGTPTNSCN